MNTLILSLIFFVVLYIGFTAIKYAFNLVFTSTLVISGSALANAYSGQTAMVIILFLTPVLYVVVTDLSGTIRSANLPFRAVKTQPDEQLHEATDLVEAAPLSGEWISGKTPEITFQQPLIGNVKTLPESPL